MPKSFIASQILCLSLALSACGGKEDPGTSVRVALTYDTAVGLDTVDVTAGADTVNAPISPELLLLLPDDAADTDMPIEVWARANGKRAAYGTTTVTPIRGSTVKATLSLTTCSPGCNNDELTACSKPPSSCALGCSEDGDAHCIAPKISNGVDPVLVENLIGTTTISADTLFNVDTGEVSGGLARASGEGSSAGVTYAQMPAPADGVPIGIFAFHNLTIEASAKVRVIGTRAVVFLVADTATIDGTVDVSAGKDSAGDAGPGGGAGATATLAAGGCGPGGNGVASTVVGSVTDGGGGGGGGGTTGARGGNANIESSPSPASGGVAGIGCLSATLVPLRGGSGGGRGTHSTQATVASGGGGGGALQITALSELTVNGTLHAGGAGGSGGPPQVGSTGGAGSGGGGGAGGALLLEAPTLTISSEAMIAANGGAGGGGGDGSYIGGSGESGRTSLEPATGGVGQIASSSGGDGGALGVRPLVGEGYITGTSIANAGGGGGAVGTIVFRARNLVASGSISPLPSKLDVLLSQ